MFMAVAFYSWPIVVYLAILIPRWILFHVANALFAYCSPFVCSLPLISLICFIRPFYIQYDNLKFYIDNIFCDEILQFFWKYLYLTFNYWDNIVRVFSSNFIITAFSES